jgi:hypothetical protein
MGMNGFNSVAAIIAKESKLLEHLRNFNFVILSRVKGLTARKRCRLFGASVPDSLCGTQYFYKIL